MREASRYFDIVSSMVRHSPAVDYVISYEETESGVGAITATLWFADESRLDFIEVFVIRAHRPIKLRYSYHYMRGAKMVFRYDNAKHHRQAETFPHHTHVDGK